jgi:hypothetical protein
VALSEQDKRIVVTKELPKDEARSSGMTPISVSSYRKC